VTATKVSGFKAWQRPAHRGGYLGARLRPRRALGPSTEVDHGPWRPLTGLALIGCCSSPSSGTIEPMVLYKNEFRLWQEMRPTQRALMLRNDADTNWLAVQLQHDRIAAFHPSPDGVTLTQQRNDVDFFFMALHRLVITAELAEKLCDPRGVLPAARTAFNDSKPAIITSIRHALEHFQNLEIRGGLGFGRGGDRWYVSYRDRMFDTQELLDAAFDLHRAIRAAVDTEAFMDFHGDHPIIELRDPADIVKPWRPDGFILDRQAAAMREIGERLQADSQAQTAS